MRILVVGGYGLIGGYVVTRLPADGHEVIGAGRQIATAQRRFPAVRWIKIDLSTATATDWEVALGGVQAVVNCSGALQDGPRESLSSAHEHGLARLAEGARRAGVSRLVHISAAGATDSPGAFGANKRAAETILQTSGVDWIVLRPGLVLGSVAFGGSALLRGLAAFPLFVPAAYPNSLVQVVSARELADAVAASVLPNRPGGLIVDLVSTQTYLLREILTGMRAWLGIPAAPIVPIPGGLAVGVAALADALAWLGWRSPMRSGALEQLRNGVQGDGRGVARLDLDIGDLASIFAAEPSGVQERWFALLYFLKPISIAVLAGFWLATGLIAIAQSSTAAMELTAAGFGDGWARGFVWLGSAVDIALGALACHRATAPWALKGMLMASAVYLTGATIWRPDLWIDPTGPLLKVLPATVLALVALAVLDER